MPKPQTEFYDRASGCQFRVTWMNEQHYREGTAFLRQLTGGNYVQRSDGVDHYIMETRQQLEAALAFQTETGREGEAVTGGHAGHLSRSAPKPRSSVCRGEPDAADAIMDRTEPSSG